MKRIVDFILGFPLIWVLHFFSKKNQVSPSKIQRLLVIKLAAFGDAILLQSVLREIHVACPGIHIHWLTSSITLPIAKRLPFIERVINWNQSPFSLFALIRQLRSQHYDVVIDYEQWARGTALISFFSGAPQRVGFKTPKQFREGLFTHYFLKEYKQHELEDFYDLTSLILPVTKNLALFMENSEGGEAELDFLFAQKQFKKSSKKWVVIHPGCGQDGVAREWPLENYAVLIHWLKSKLNVDVFISAGPDEKKKAFQLAQLVGKGALNLGGELSWEGTISLLSKANLLISGNTGIMHVAAALHIPQVALHGPTNPLLWGPLNPNAQVVQSSCPKCPSLKLGYEYHTNDQSCMRRIEIDTVKEAVVSLKIC